MRPQPFGTALLAAAALALAGAPATAQEGASDAVVLDDGRWLPFVGCWVDAEAAGPMTCVVPEGTGVALLTVSGAAVTHRRVLRADGVERPMEAAGCAGTEAAEFSGDGHRVYTRTTLACDGAGARPGRGLMAMVDADAWIEVRTIGVDDGSVAWVKRFAPAPAGRVEAAGLAERLAAVAPPRVLEAARIAAASAASVEDIIEAHGRTDAAAVRAWIAEDGDPIRLDADRLVRLADAGVPAEVIDVAVAVSFPDRFAVAREPRDRRYGDSVDAFGPWGPWGSWGLWNPFSYRYGGYYGYYDRGFYGPGYGSIGYRPTVVVVAPVQPSPGGRVIRGRGYTRGSQGSGVATPSIRAGSPSSARAGTPSRASSGSSGGSKGKAKPRGG